MATLPISGTNIRLLSGVPFSNDYKHTRWFDSQSEQTAYFMGKPVVHSIPNSSFQRIEGRGFIKVNKNIDQLWGTNYVMFQNADYGAKWFYGFVTKMEYKNDSMTEVYFQIDVFQTWKFQLTFKPSYVSREHCKLWENGNPVINTVDEGLGYGAEYEVKDVENYNVNGDVLYLVIVAKSTLHNGDFPTGTIVSSINGAPQPLCMYVHPFDSYGGSPDIRYDGQTFVLSNVLEVLNSIYQLQDAVNNIVSLYITNHVGLNATFSGGDLVIEFNTFQNFEVVNVGGAFQTIYIEELKNYFPKRIGGKSKYTGLMSGVTESKLLMYPYSFVELTDLKGNTAILKNEYIDSTTIDMMVYGSMGYSNKVAYVPLNYLGASNDTKVMMGRGMIDNTPNDVAVITDLLAAFFQGNRNSLMNKADSIAFNGAVSVASSGMGAIGNLMQGNVGGALSSTVGVVSGGGNAILQMEGLQAKVKDIDNTPPQISKMGSNSAFDFGNGLLGYWLISKQITPEYKKKLQGFWKMSGYKVNEVKIPNFHTRQNWNFVQTVSCNVVGSINNVDLVEYKTIFDNGITLWHTDDVGNYSLGNEVI